MSFYSSVLATSSDSLMFDKKSRKEFSVLIPILDLDSEYILFEKRAMTIPQPGEICFPGGMKENSDINFMETALRETSEELGITRDKIKIAKYLGYMMANSGALIHIHVGKLDIKSTAKLKPNPKEVDSILTVPASFFANTKPDIYQLQRKIMTGNFPAKELGLPEKYHHDWNSGTTNICVYNYHDTIIWGLTASILYQLNEKMKSTV